MKTRIALATALLSAFLSFNAYSCGDSLYRVGKGVAYRVYSAPLPGNLLVYGSSESAKSLAEELAKTGHGVNIVGSAAELETELQKGGYDVVIAPFSEHTTIESTSGADASFLPIAMNREEEKRARQSYERVMMPQKHELKHYLKAIHKTLKSRA